MAVNPLEFGTGVCGAVNLRTQVIVHRYIEEDSDYGMEWMDEKAQSLRKEIDFPCTEEDEHVGWWQWY